jgi:hypothetical protein
MRKPLCALALLALAASGCGREAAAPKFAPLDAEVAAQSIDLSGHRGQSFEAFSKSPGMERFALSRLDLSADERTRVERDLAAAQPSRLVVGGGAQALVFVGCARAGCEAGETVLAFGSQGETFVGVREQGAPQAFIPNDRMEALLGLASPSTHWWDNPGGGLTGAEAGQSP